jgi:hypothetical protein
MCLNLQEYKVEAGMLGVILPEQIIQLGSYTEDFEGLFIVISKDFVEGILPTIQKLFPVSLLVKDHPCIRITPEEKQTFCQYHSFLRSKVRQQRHPFRREVAQGLLISLFYEIYGIYLQRNIQVKDSESLQEEQFRQFMHLVSEYCKQERSVTFYAGKMCLSSKHLSAEGQWAYGRRVDRQPGGIGSQGPAQIVGRQHPGDCRRAAFCQPVFFRQVFQTTCRDVSQGIPEPIKREEAVSK